jgi:hypothetical protein
VLQVPAESIQAPADDEVEPTPAGGRVQFVQGRPPILRP